MVSTAVPVDKPITSGPRPENSVPNNIAPKPVCLADTGLSVQFLGDLLSKHLAISGVLDQQALAKRLALSGNIIEVVTDFLRAEGVAELRTQRDGSRMLRFGLTERGRAAANDALLRDGYVGPAPVSLSLYTEAVRAQSPGLIPVTRERVYELFADTVISRELLDRLGPAVRSCRSVFVYGHPGTGKTFIASRLGRLLGPPVLLPNAFLVGDSVVRCLDPAVHHPLDVNAGADSHLLTLGFDARFSLCQRPVVKAAGELTADMLELQYDSATRQYMAPLQVKANTGMLIIDDLGRQRVSCEDLLNRWIVPLDEGSDQLMLMTGQHFTVPFEMATIFATNLNPEDLADDAFLRRMGYKVKFEPSVREEYVKIWLQVCDKLSISGQGLVDFVLSELYEESGIPLLPCHPRDLLKLADDYSRYSSGPVDEVALRWAWNNYFIDRA